jgi:hypothetical protein
MRERGGGRSSITALRSVYYMTKVLLAIFVGLFRRNVVPEAGSAAGARPGERAAAGGPEEASQ